MKLISCHIENFGALSDKDFDFSEGITQFCQDNGWGKSTLAAFVKAMFYGLPSVRSNSKFNERKHFYPFSGGKFGGNLTFARADKTYRIERFFGKSSETDDELKVFIDGVQSAEFDEKNGRTVGEIIFGLDEQSFARTAFVTSETTLQTTGGINAKLNGYSLATDGEANAEAAQSALEKAIKSLKMRGGKGEIAETEDEISRLNASIADVKKVAESLDGKHVENNALARRIAELELAQEERNRREAELNKWAHYDDMLSEAAKWKKELAALTEKYPKGLPDGREIADLSAACRERAALSERIKSSEFPAEKIKRLNKLAEAFPSGAPSEEELKAIGADVDKLRDLRSEKSALSSPPDEKLVALEERFKNRTPEEGELENLRAKVREYKLAQGELLELSERPVQPAPVRRKNLPSAVAAVLAAALIIGGAACVSFALYVAIALFAAGGVCAAAAIIVYFKVRGGAAATSPDSSSAVASAKARMNAAEREIHEFLVPYHIYSSNVEYDFRVFEDSLKEYVALTAAQEERRERLSFVCAEEEKLCQSLENRFAAYGISGADYAANLATLRALAEEYARLNAERQSLREAEVSLKARLEGVNAGISAVLEKYGIAEGEGDLIPVLERDGAMFRRLTSGTAESEQKAEKFRQSNNLTERPAPVADGGEDQELSAARARKAVLIREIAEAEATTETLPDRLNKLENAKDKLAVLNEKYYVLTAARDAIKRASDKLNQEYVAPVQNGFSEYARLMRRFADVKIVMDKNFSLSFESGGELRSIEHLSAGQRAVCSLCFRLALIDNMYAGEKPFIVMDDPFADLDGDSLETAKRLLIKLSESRQIIYFCCHESRALDNA